MDIIEKIILFSGSGILLVAIILTFIGSIRLRKPAADQPEKATYEVVGRIADIANYAAAVFITLVLISRAIQSGHGPFSNMYEFAVAFSWGIILVGLVFRRFYKIAAVQNIGSIVAFLLLVFAVIQFTRPAPLVPALQQSVLLSSHVACAIAAYGTLTIGFGAAIMVLAGSGRSSSWMSETEVLDRISYHSVIVGFPLLTLLIILGALWADISWGSYWSWDPKESASLVTWLIYAGYLHARTIRGWKGRRAAILLVTGFAAILVTFFGNFVFNGLHSYV
jgi:cytochrome c-type biogenesis protein CcsB